MKRLAIITTHPIQYYAPLFRLLTEKNRIQVKVFYTWGEASLQNKFDPGFGKVVSWDIPLLEGYDYTFVTNVAEEPGSHHFNGIINPSLKKEIEDWQATAILVFGWSFKSHLNIIRYFKGKIPVLFRGDSNLIDEQKGFSLKKIIRRFFLSWVYSYIDIALYVGAANKAYYIANRVPEHKLLFAPHAVDNSRFSADAENAEAQAASWRKELGIENKEVVFLYAAKLIAKKQPELLIASFLSLQIPDAQLIVVGNGEMEIYLKEKYKASTNIIFINFQNQSVMPVVYRLADVYVLPSKGPGETWGLAVNEAMACGRAVIVSNKVGCAIDLIKPGENGYIFEAGNFDDIRSKLDLIISRKADLKLMGERSLGIINKWNYLSITEAIEEALNN